MTGLPVIDQNVLLMKVGSVLEHPSALFHVMGLKCAKHDFFRYP